RGTPPCSYAKTSHVCPLRSRTRSAFLEQTIWRTADPIAAAPPISCARQVGRRCWPRRILGLGENLCRRRDTSLSAGLSCPGVGCQRPTFTQVGFAIT